jgi:hypothetical protein
MSSVTVVVSALNKVTTQQAVALAVPAVLLTVGGLAFRVVSDAWIAWRRGFRQGCQTALTSQDCLIRPDDAGSSFGQIRLAKVTANPAARYCAVCGRASSNLSISSRWREKRRWLSTYPACAGDVG